MAEKITFKRISPGYYLSSNGFTLTKIGGFDEHWSVYPTGKIVAKQDKEKFQQLKHAKEWVSKQ